MQCLMVAFYLSSTSWMVRLSKNKLDSIIAGFLFEALGHKLLAIVKIYLLRNSAFSQCPVQAINSTLGIFIQICFWPYSVPWTIICKTCYIDLAKPSNAELEGIALPHRINMMPCKSLAWLWLCLDSYQQSFALYDIMYGFPMYGNIELIFYPSCTPWRIFLF